MEKCLLERLAIRELIEAYGDGVTRRDRDAWASVWAEDSTWTLPDQAPVRGRDNIVAFWLKELESYPLVVHSATPARIMVEGDRAHGVAYTSEVATLVDGQTLRLRGRYDDEFIKERGNWLFRSRTFNVLHVG